MLPINYLHFEMMYIITQEDDTETINLCKQFDNVVLLYYNFKNNNKPFDKYGGLNYGQKIIYETHPDSWYLIIDSDILLPTNFIEILNNEHLIETCIYGGIRNNCYKSSELLNKKEIIHNSITWLHNNILHSKNNPPSILGCFQLYKLKNVYHRDNIENAGLGDYYFGYDNFKLFCNLENIYYFHLGEKHINWNGKIVDFNDDIQISINKLFYKCYRRVNNIYYNDKCQLVKYGNTENINHDIWTCSDKMRHDIYTFFKNEQHYRIAEIGAHKGYTTKILSNIFYMVYAIDNNIEWTNYNKKYNKDANNIEYVKLDIYNEPWVVPYNGIEVSFIDACHTYESCKKDIINSINTFTKLKYIIFDDYGVWPGVKKVVDEFINMNVLKFETYIGINDVPGPNGIVKNTYEGIICSVNIPTVKQKPKHKLLFNYK